MKFEKLSGLVAAAFTPFKPDGKLNLSQVPLLGESLRKNKISAAFICGTTGEGSSMTTTERVTVAEEWKKTKPAGLRLAVHVGHNSLADSLVLAQHAEEIGADAIAMIAPSYFRPASLDDLVDCCRYVASGAPRLPFYYYHMPESTGVGFDMREFLRLASKKIPNLAGLKFTYHDLKNFQQALAFAQDKYAVLHGRDETLIAGLVLGSTGAIGSTYNYAAPVYHRVLQAYRERDIVTARLEQEQAVEIVEVMLRHGGLPAGKAIMKLIGLDCGGVRLPLRSLDDAAVSLLKADLDKLGFFASCS